DYSNPVDVEGSSAGGTSFASPSFAGIQALINQETGTKWGNPNPVLYVLAASEYGSTADPNSANLSACDANNGNTVGDACVFYDVTRGDNDIPCQPSPGGKLNCYRPAGAVFGVLSTSMTTLDPAFPATPGWDFASGLGSVNVTNLVNGWSAAACTHGDTLRGKGALRSDARC
ncbi:MAG TPA: hypothetical protein VEJ86_00970, partial [Candidatus Binataceae bacterium]|nr:hypothetical protein [Candidatus Binataceae bacterium]